MTCGQRVVEWTKAEEVAPSRIVRTAATASPRSRALTTAYHVEPRVMMTHQTPFPFQRARPSALMDHGAVSSASATDDRQIGPRRRRSQRRTAPLGAVKTYRALTRADRMCGVVSPTGKCFAQALMSPAESFDAALRRDTSRSDTDDPHDDRCAVRGMSATWSQVKSMHTMRTLRREARYASAEAGVVGHIPKRWTRLSLPLRRRRQSPPPAPPSSMATRAARIARFTQDFHLYVRRRSGRTTTTHRASRTARSIHGYTVPAKYPSMHGAASRGCRSRSNSPLPVRPLASVGTSMKKITTDGHQGRADEPPQSVLLLPRLSLQHTAAPVLRPFMMTSASDSFPLN